MQVHRPLQPSTLATDITQVGSNSNVYFLQEGDGGMFEIYFGDGIVGKAVSDNNIVVLEYIVTNKTKANGAKNFTTAATISGITDVTTATVSVASGGSEPESIQSIKLNAPLDYASSRSCGYSRRLQINYSKGIPKY